MPRGQKREREQLHTRANWEIPPPSSTYARRASSNILIKVKARRGNNLTEKWMIKGTTINWWSVGTNLTSAGVKNADELDVHVILFFPPFCLVFFFHFLPFPLPLWPLSQCPWLRVGMEWEQPTHADGYLNNGKWRTIWKMTVDEI